MALDVRARSESSTGGRLPETATKASSASEPTTARPGISAEVDLESSDDDMPALRAVPVTVDEDEPVTAE